MSMTELHPRAAAESFLDLLLETCSAVQSHWFLLPVAQEDRAPVYRERVYCYELYHQLRVRTEGHAVAGSPAYVLSGEIDKAGLHTVIANGTHKPDLVWHVPGEHLNAVVAEVKTTSKWDRGGVRKDLQTLAAFLTAEDRAYARGVLLMFGPGDDDIICQRVRELVPASEQPALRQAHLVWHPEPGTPARDLGPIGR
ncbi:hypothetical protein ACWZJV_25460 [Nocardioides sp. WG-D5]